MNKNTEKDLQKANDLITEANNLISKANTREQKATKNKQWSKESDYESLHIAGKIALTSERLQEPQEILSTLINN